MYFYRIIFLCYFLILCASTEEEGSAPMSKEERISLREEARKMFYHAYDAYMDNAFPADELMPLSCKGRWRGVTPSRGDLDDVLGNFTLTLVDSLDTLVVLGDFQEFDRSIRYVIKNVNFDTDVVVSVFETNIRVLGGLLSAHVLADELRHSVPVLGWYDDQLLNLAEDLGRRLLPAFNTTTGIPHGRINLRRGMQGLSHNRETCTACAGTIILEFAALSRLTGNPVFEQRASKTMDRLWKTRHRTSDLMGTTIDVQSGDWVRKDSGVGAGIDSYYEYCLKAYILLGDNKYLKRFNRHYNAIKKYISRGPLMLAVYMHRPHLQSRNFMDALLAFWPGLQVMMGDVRPAVETHEMLYQVMQRHTFIPEAFTTDFQVHWGQHPLRPEFLESTYFLHRATGDDHYLRVGRDILRALQQHARVPCGYAAVNDVRTRVHEDRMDSFVLAETFKYLFMLFSEDRDLPVNIEKYIMTTEAHFLPLSLGQVKRNATSRMTVLDEDDEERARRTCPSTSSLQPEKVREPMRQMVGATAARPPARLRPINDPRQLSALSDMGISVLTLPDGRVQLLYTTNTARSANDAAEGLTFMREMSRWNSLGDADNGVQLITIQFGENILLAGPAHFGQEISGDNTFQGTAALVAPPDACSEIFNKMEVAHKIGIAFRGQCTFTQKVRNMQLADIKLAIIIDNVQGSSAEQSALFAMSNDGKQSVDVVIPSAFLYSKEGAILLDALKKEPDMMLTLAEKGRYERINTCSDNTCQESASTPERESFANLQTVLADLVEQFELSLKSEEKPKRNFKIPHLVYNQDKFEAGLDQSAGIPKIIEITSKEAELPVESQDRAIDNKDENKDGDKDNKQDTRYNDNNQDSGEESSTKDADSKEDSNDPGDKDDTNGPTDGDRSNNDNLNDKKNCQSDTASGGVPEVVVTDYDADKKAASPTYSTYGFDTNKTPDPNLTEYSIKPEMGMKEFKEKADNYKKTMRENPQSTYPQHRYYYKYGIDRGLLPSRGPQYPDEEVEGPTCSAKGMGAGAEQGQAKGEIAAGPSGSNERFAEDEEEDEEFSSESSDD